MTVAVATLVAKTVAAIASTTNSLAVYSYNSKAAIEGAELYNRTTMSVLAGVFFNFIVKTFGDNLNVGDSQTLSTSKQQSEEVQVSETVDIVANFNRLPTETVNLEEVVAKGLTTTFPDNLQVGDSPSIEPRRVVLDNAQLSDIINSIVYNRNIADLVNLTDDLNGAALDDDQVVQYFKSGSDQLQLSNPGVVSVQNYVTAPGYFSSDYVGTSRQIS
jgi:hypothetical protein